jgi:tetratricopeptide (TPR) repeat protein
VKTVFGLKSCWTEKLLSYSNGPNHLRAKALDQGGFLARYQADYQSAQEFITESLAIWRYLQDRKGQADLLANLGFVTLFQGDREDAKKLYQESLELNRLLENQQGIADALSHLGIIGLAEGEFERSHALNDEAMTI